MFVHLHCHSPYSFLDGASDIRSLVRRAADLEMLALALTDHNNLCGAVDFHHEALAAGIKPVLGAEVTLEGGYHLTLLAENPAGYANLCRLLTAAHLKNPRLQPVVSKEDLSRYSPGLIALSGCRRGEVPALLLGGRPDRARAVLAEYIAIFGRESFLIELQGCLLPGDRALNEGLCRLAEKHGLRTVATSNVHYTTRDRFQIHDLLTCVRTLTRLEDVHPERRLNAENYLKRPEEMAALFRHRPEALRNTLEVAGRCREVLELGRHLHPAYDLPSGVRAEDYLRIQVYKGARERYGRVTGRLAERLEKELNIINQLGYADYFLLVWDVVRFARREGIRCAGRGSAADSAVAYCLYITEVDAVGRSLLFERFMSLERAEKPDIDVDFDARGRDRVAAYVYKKYGKERVAAVGTFNTFRARAALRDLGKVMEFPEPELDALAKRIPYYFSCNLEEALTRSPEIRDSGLPLEKYGPLFRAAREIIGFPRHLGTHMGGLVISPRPLNELAPLQQAAKGVVVCQLDKRGVEDLGLVKLDLLSLRTLSAVDEAVANLRRKNQGFDYDRIPLDDRETYAMINRGETIGVFQLESPAQRALQARLEADNLEDIVASVALIRPGPIKGNMVEPFIERRHGLKPVTYLHPDLEPILKKTYGVVLFQEQVIEIATAIAGFTPGEADRLRRVMTHARSPAEMEEIGRIFTARARARGIEEGVAAAIFSYIVGYASYGFCEAHAAAFATTAYKTAYLVRHHPAEFFAAVLNNQPMGFYPPGTICVEARRRGVEILPPDINRSQDNFTVEDGSMRVGLRQVREMSRQALKSIAAARKQGPFLSLADFLLRTGVNREIAANLILAGAFDQLHPNRRSLLWQLEDFCRNRYGEALKQTRVIRGTPAPQRISGMTMGFSEFSEVPDFSPLRKLAQEYHVLGLAVRRHPMEVLRPQLEERQFVSSHGLARLPAGTRVRLAGIPVRPHRPPTRSGRVIVFMSLEDEFGLAEVTVFEEVYQRDGRYIFREVVLPLVVTGRVDRRGQAAGVVAERVDILKT